MITNAFSIDLGLAHIEILSMRIDQKDCDHLNIRSTEIEVCCHACQSVPYSFHGYDREITIQHLSILGH